MNKWSFAIVMVPLLSIDTSTASALEKNYAKREDVQLFIQQMVENHQFKPEELYPIFEKVRFQPTVIKAITPQPPQEQSWQDYRSSFINPKRIKGGVEFWNKHEETLKRAYKEFGIPEEIIVAIIGVETIFGTRTGNYRVIDSLTTLAFDYPPRAKFFRSELSEFLLFSRNMNINLFDIKGSYAGAIGIPQFMPTSYRRFAVDFDGDGKRDLTGNFTDTIGSIANFLKQHGWEPDQPIALPAEVNGEQYQQLLAAGIKPKYKIAELSQYGIKPTNFDQPFSDQALCALIDLPTPNQQTEFLLGLQNFYTLTRYNRSNFYATAVIELARAIKKQKVSSF